MVPSRLWERLRPVTPRSKRHDMLGLSSIDAFLEKIERERSRADRTGREFSLIVFTVEDGHRKNEFSRDLVRALASRARSSDETGWLPGRAIGIILPDTSAAGAWTLAGAIQRELPSGVPLPECSVYRYPVPRHGPGVPDKGGSPARPLEELLPENLPSWKRACDVVAALVGLILLSPLFLLIAILIKVVSPGPAFFCQTRVGYRGRPFIFWKFRTMTIDPDQSVHSQYLRTLIHGDQPMAKLDAGNDERIIPLGRFLRRSCLDELPQLFNVLRGDMSLIGPRPCLSYEAEEFLPWHRRRFDTVPGMTGLWQVSGKNRLTFKTMVRLDIGYSRRRSPLLDARILLRTIPAVIAQTVAGSSRGKVPGKKGEVVYAESKDA